ncbi:PREDICTED: multidrug resistance-associated protein 1-like [Rhagoletis zephyria]|uniref:multidrug resistance-associated protein 1-like n=1 Tax=Rhagoletis zephyria TaxID=28612 RepID=UPI0008112667|nr:PREDICTED: multidrug resistance-associated protein 1-like [Rhagoletis zephyria]
MQARKGQLVAIVGQVGSGKSSLISALLGDMHKLGGVVKINRSIAYVAQQAWIQNATVRENILFLNRYDEEKYRAVVDACALAPDLAILPAGDQTEIGEKGITLSGGQKQRIAIARAAYTAASLYLLDDPLSALDAHVSRHIFDRVIGPKGMLRTATRILVTHRMAVLSQCDYIYVMKKGRVVESGTFAQLLAARGREGGGGGGSFSELLTNYLVAHEEHTGASSSSEEEEGGVFGEANPRHSFTGSFEGDESDQEDLETARRKVLAEDDIDETELFINSVFKEIDELSVGGGEEGEVYLPDHHQLKPKANRVVSFLELSQPPSGQSSLASSVPSSVSSRASARSTSSTKAIYPKELANTTQIQPEGRVTLHQNTTVEQSTGSSSVTMSAYGKYFKRLGLLACAFILLSQCAQLLCNIAAAQWLSRWSEEQLVNSGHKPEVPADDNYSTNLRNLAVYTVLGLGECFFTLFTTLVISFSTLKAAKLLHADMLSRILRAPMSFFDTNPIGRILNRFSRDIDICDTILNMNLRIALFTAFRTVAAILIIAIDTPPVLGAVLPLAIFYFVIQRMFLPTSRQLRRIESTTRSPIYSHFDESLSGSSTIRAFGKQSAFIIESNRRIDQNHVASWAINGCTQWIITRLEFLGYMVVFANALYCLINRENIQASITGLTLTYSMTITRNLNHFIMVTSELENSVVSFERCLEYCKMTTEADYYKDEQDPPEAQPKSTDQTSTSLAEVWPSQGAIEFRDFSTRYRPNLDLVLKSINFIVLPGERVGVVGRTGAGKSSLTLALFRILERASGKIIVDGRDIADLGLHSIRSRMTIIPQDPVLFTGTLRLNIDPFGKHSDEELWSALELVNLRPFVQSFEAGLNHTITEGGDNLSVGQRQLLSLARALLRKSRILVLDEATAAVDMETDAIIQQTIRQHFFGSTILTIAHRIETIFDYDRILLMHNGEVLEYDSPERLIATPHSLFRSLAREAGLV